MALRPKDLPKALAEVQEIESNRITTSHEIRDARNQVNRYRNAHNDIRNIPK